jgi:hypothetical protein
MEINGEINIEIDQYQDVSFEIDTEQLAETLCQDHNLVDDVVLHAYVDERIDERMDDYDLRVQVDDLVLEVDEVREKIRKIEPDTDNYSFVRYHMLDNYVRINDLRKIIEEIVRAEICVAFAAGHHKMQDRLNGIDIEKKENQ